MLMRATHGNTVEQPGPLRDFELLAKSPGGVARLRDLILTLAVQGKLVEQDAGDEPATVLLQGLRAEKERLVAGGEVRRDKPLAAIRDDEIPFALPPGWAFARLGDLIFSIKSGGTPSKQNSDFWGGDIPWASVKDLKFGEPIYDTQDRITAAGLEAGSNLAETGSVLICTRMGLGKIGVAMVDIAINQDLKALKLGCQIDKAYFVNFFKTLSLIGSGMTVAGIKQDELLSIVVPTPPADEQTRIVARVEELMRLCDALEAKGKLEGAQHSQLLTTLLRTLTDSSSAEELAGNWQRVAAHFDLLLDRPEAVDALEQTILQLAVRGLLVPQDPQDEPASVLLQSIRAQKGRLIAEGKIKRDKQADGIADDERFFDIPITWCWAQAQDVCDPGSLITYGILKPVWVDVGVPTVRVQDLKNGKIVTSSLGQCAPDRADRFDKTKLAAGDLLIAKDGATLGKTAFVPPELAGANVTQHVLRFPISGVVSRQYVRLIVDSAYGQAWMKSETKGVALPGVNVGDFRRMPIPLPPLAEQVRIFARVTELRHLCAELRQRLASARNVQAQFAQAQVEALAL